MTTVPGFSSRTTETTIRQFPQRDEVTMTDIAGMDSPGWSNANSDPNATADAKTVNETDSKVVEADAVEDKAVAKKTTARKTAQKKG